VTNFRDLISQDFDDSELNKLKEFAKYYTAFMTLGTATQADATSGSKGDTGHYMAHMYALLIPNHTLQEWDIKLGKETIVSEDKLAVMIGEGTGFVHPDQRGVSHNGKAPRYQTTEGRKFTDGMSNDMSKGGPKRIIYSPPTEDNNHVVAEFYKHVVTAAGPMGLLKFTNGKGELGALMSDIIHGNRNNINVSVVDGTRWDEMNREYQNLAKALLGMYEPILPLHYNEDSPKLEGALSAYIKGKYGKDIKKITRIDTKIIFPYQEIGKLVEHRFIQWLKDKGPEIESINFYSDIICDTGAYVLVIQLKKR